MSEAQEGEALLASIKKTIANLRDEPRRVWERQMQPVRCLVKDCAWAGPEGAFCNHAFDRHGIFPMFWMDFCEFIEDEAIKDASDKDE